MSEFALARVAKGAAYLDKKKPGWFNRVDIGTLTLYDACDCVVGQLHNRRYGLGMRRLGLSTDTSDETMPAIAFGFYKGFGVTWRDLEDAWIAAIADRKLAQDAVSEPVVAHVER